MDARAAAAAAARAVEVEVEVEGGQAPEGAAALVTVAPPVAQMAPTVGGRSAAAAEVAPAKRHVVRE